MIQPNIFKVSKEIYIPFPSGKPVWETGKSRKPTYIQYDSKLISKRVSSSGEVDVKGFMNSLNKITDFFEIIYSSESIFPDNKKYIFQRLMDIKVMHDPKEGDDISLESLKGLLVFLYSVKDFKKPSITLNDLGFLQMNWKRDKNNLLTVSFKENYFLNYVIFMPSGFTDKRIILNGSMNILDLGNYLSKLCIKLHREGK